MPSRLLLPTEPKPPDRSPKCMRRGSSCELAAPSDAPGRNAAPELPAMLLRYFAEDGTYDVEAPDGTRIAFRSHVQVGANAFLDDILMVPWQDRLAPIPGEIVPALARTGLYGLRLLHCPRCADAAPILTLDAVAARPCATRGDHDPASSL